VLVGTRRACWGGPVVGNKLVIKQQTVYCGPIFLSVAWLFLVGSTQSGS
jgi:hypothetical protein